MLEARVFFVRLGASLPCPRPPWLLAGTDQSPRRPLPTWSAANEAVALSHTEPAGIEEMGTARAAAVPKGVSNSKHRRGRKEGPGKGTRLLAPGPRCLFKSASPHCKPRKRRSWVGVGVGQSVRRAVLIFVPELEAGVGACCVRNSHRHHGCQGENLNGMSLIAFLMYCGPGQKSLPLHFHTSLI